MTSSTARTAVRKLGRNWLGVALSLLIVACVSVALWHLLRDIDAGKVIAAFTAQPIRNIAIAGVFVVLGYITLTFYDVFALHIIGRRTVPFHVAALASFTSYTIGHSLGAATLTGAVVRLRVYSAWGLNVLDIGKIAFVTGMTFWLGNAVVLGGAMAYAPEAAGVIDHLPSWINRIIGLMALLGIACYLTWLAPRPRTVGYANWKLVLPTMRLTLVQTGIGAMDLCLVTAAMYSLAAAEPRGRFRAGAGHFRHGDAARHRQPCAGQPRRHRSGTPHRAAAISQRGTARGAADLSRRLFRDSVPARHAGARPARARLGGAAEDNVATIVMPATAAEILRYAWMSPNEG